MIVSEFLDALFEAFPAQDAETWDHVGLSAGDQNQEVSGVLCALDATEAALEQAEAFGANVLLTHHPVYLKAPDAFGPSRSDLPACSSVVYRAIRNGISIISMHTNLDRSLAAREYLPALVGLSAVRSLESDDPSHHGLGALCPCHGLSQRFWAGPSVTLAILPVKWERMRLYAGKWATIGPRTCMSAAVR